MLVGSLMKATFDKLTDLIKIQFVTETALYRRRVTGRTQCPLPPAHRALHNEANPNFEHFGSSATRNINRPDTSRPAWFSRNKQATVLQPSLRADHISLSHIPPDSLRLLTIEISISFQICALLGYYAAQSGNCQKSSSI
jgi:hypothetical protein